MAYFIIKNCLLIPKFTYFLRTTHLFLFPTFLEKADILLKDTLQSILNIPLDNHNWVQATLPIKLGGLGIRTLTDICLPAFISSAYGAFDFIKLLFPVYSDAVNLCHVSEAILLWSGKTNNSTPPTDPGIQKEWDEVISKQTLTSLSSSLKSDKDIARLKALQAKESGSWLHALPSSFVGTLMESKSFQIAIALRLGCKICHVHQCICGETVDSFGHHPLNCAKSRGRFSRHSAINNIISRSFASCNIPTLLETSGISRMDGRRPDGMTLIPWSHGKSLIWDFTCIDTLASSHLQSSLKCEGSTAESATQSKKRKYNNLTSNYIFVAFAVETFGPWCKDAKDLVFQLGRRLLSTSGDPRCVNFLRQRIGIAVQQGNAISILGSFPSSNSLEEIFHL